MGKISEIMKSAKAPWTHLPSQHFEELRHLEHSELISPINLQVKESMYDIHPTWKMSYIWTQFEKLINSIFHDLRTISDDETCVQVRIGTLHALQPKWLILQEMMESLNSLGYTDCYIFADKADLLLFYGQQAETLVNEAIEYIDCFFDSNLVIDLREARNISIEEWSMESLYSGLFKTSITLESVEKCKLFIKSLNGLSSLLRDCAYSQTYYLFKNTMGLFNNVDRFQHQDVGIYQYRRRIFIQDYNNALKSLGRKEAVPNPESISALREKAFSDTMHKSYSEVYLLYEICRGKLESLNDSRDYTEEGWLRAIFTDLFQTHYMGEQRDSDGKITTVFIDERGNTSVDGRCGWERWLDFLTVISLVRDYEQKYQPETSVKLESSANTTTKKSVSVLEVETLVAKELKIEGVGHSHFPELISVEESTKLYEFLSRERFIDGNKTPLADFNYLMGAANQYTTHDGPKPICWLKNRQMLREMLTRAFATLLENGTTLKSLADLVPCCFVDKNNVALSLSKNNARQIVKQEMDALDEFFATITRPHQTS